MLRKLAGCAIGFGLSMSLSSAFAQDALLDGNLVANATVLTENFVASATSYSFFEGWSSVAGGSSAIGSFGAEIVNASTNAVLSSLFVPATTSAPGATFASPVNGFVVGDTYTLKAFAAAFPSTPYTVNGFVSTAVASSVAAPGPITGAGLPALLGFFGVSVMFWRKKLFGVG